MIRISSNTAAKCFGLVFLVCFSKNSNNKVLSFLLLPLEKCRRVMIHSNNNNNKLCMSSTKKQEKPQTTQEADDETPLNPVGAQFFGGSAEKEELFDEEIEKNSANASTLVLLATYNRFDNLDAFPDAVAKSVARKYQASLNALLYQQDESSSEGTTTTEDIYSSDFTWISPLKSFKEGRTPFEEIATAMDFYRRMDISIISAKSSTTTSNANKMELRWMISLVWPNFWEAQVTITGTSMLTMNGLQITKQEDSLDNGDITNAIAWQLLPRFWDMFHIGMTPSAEIQPRLPVPHKNMVFSNYQVFDIPPRYVLKPSVLDQGSRDMRLAQVLPSSAFSCFIVTAGKFKQRYVPTTPVEVRINSETQQGGGTARRITWTIPVPTLVASALDLPIPAEMSPSSSSSANDEYYSFDTTRRVATIPYSGNPQDEKVADLRKKMYDSVVRDGFRPKLDDAGKPIFFFIQNKIKCCFTEGGFGMAVYESRPKLLSNDDVGIELEID